MTRKNLLRISGWFSIIMGIDVWFFVGIGKLNYEYFGSDAYTSIQNAICAQAHTTQHGLGGILIAGGMVLLAFTLPETDKAGGKPKESETAQAQKATGETAPVTCGECGQPLPEHAIACPNCGCPVEHT